MIMRFFILIGMLLSGAISVWGAAPDGRSESNDMDFWVRGTVTGWSCQEDYKFSYQNGAYSIHLDELDGEFKISNADWKYNYGAEGHEVMDVTHSAVLSGNPNGPNWRARSLRNVEISFSRGETHGLTDIPIKVDGEEIPESWADYLSGTLPVLHINVFTGPDHLSYDNEVIDRNLSHKDYFTEAEYWLDLNGCEDITGAQPIGSSDEPLPLQIKARGNFTRLAFAKKPFKLKLGKKQNLLGLTPEKSKHYALLAHADDNYGYMRNFTGFNLGKRMGLPWTPSMIPVEVVINGDYRGLYFLTESIRVGDGRVGIAELDDNETDADLITGGYIVELDNYEEDNQIRFPEKPYANGDRTVRVTFDTPEEYSEMQREFISKQFNVINDLIGEDSDEMWNYLDLDDAVKYYLVEEMISHVEAYHGSTYLYRDRGEGEKWHFSPLWDCGQAFNGPTNGHFFNNSPYGTTWIHSLFRNKTFIEKAGEVWKWFMANRYEGLMDDLEEYAESLKEAAQCDRRRWRDVPRPDFSNAMEVADNVDMDERLRTVKRHLERKLEWMKGVFGDYMAVEDAFMDDSSEAVYYNLQGMRVMSPVPGSIYIVLKGSESRKIIFKP